MSPPPILARVWRGNRIGSVHRGSVAVMDAEGRLVAAAGVPRGRIYLRSAAKPFQAMPPLEAGGEQAFRLGNDEIALAPVVENVRGLAVGRIESRVPLEE